MSLLKEISTPPMYLDALEGVAERRQMAEATALAGVLKKKLEGKVIWNLSSTAAGGGVAEMLHRLIGYARGAGFDSRWLVISGTPEFFRVTKRLHNALHGEPGDGLPLEETARRIYEDTLRGNAEEFRARVRPGDLVFLHDPQTVGLAPVLANAGVAVVWRCHVGNGGAASDEERLGWHFLESYLADVDCCVFTRPQYVPVYLRSKTVIIPPNIDPLSPKNQSMTHATTRAILAHIGVVAGPAGRGNPLFLRRDGTPTRVGRTAAVVRCGTPPTVDTPVVVQVSRWDRLKDPVGVVRGFACFVTRGLGNEAHLFLVGPRCDGVTDDPEGSEVFEECVRVWERLDETVRRRVHLISLPMDDMEENAAMVNAIQRHATVVVQKSIREGFGLTVTEAMWKGKPVIGSAVGGIQDQIQHQRTGLLVDPCDDDGFADALTWVLENPVRARAMGRRAKARVKREYLGVRSLLRWGGLIGRLLDDGTVRATD